MPKVIFTCLGPDRKYTSVDGTEYVDGDTPILNEEDYEKAVTSSKFAQDYDPDLEIRTKRLLVSAEKKRAEVLEKMKKIKR